MPCEDVDDNCFVPDTNLLESVQTASAKLILGCFWTTSHENILNDIDLTPFHVRR